MADGELTKRISQSVPAGPMYQAANALLAEHGANEGSSQAFILGVLALEIMALRKRITELEASHARS